MRRKINIQIRKKIIDNKLYEKYSNLVLLDICKNYLGVLIQERFFFLPQRLQALSALGRMDNLAQVV